MHLSDGAVHGPLRGMQSACPGPTSMGAPSTVHVNTPAMPYVSDWAPVAACATAPGDAEALASTIVSMIEQPGERRRLAKAARDLVVGHDVEWSTGQFGRLYEGLAGR
jgi:hypothetical protein